MVGKAFKIAFAQSKFPEGSELKLQPMNNDPASGGSPGNQGRRWVSQPKRLGMGGGTENGEACWNFKLSPNRYNEVYPLIPWKYLDLNSPNLC